MKLFTRVCLSLRYFGIYQSSPFRNDFFVYISSLSSHGKKAELEVCAFEGDFIPLCNCFTVFWGGTT